MRKLFLLAFVAVLLTACEGKQGPVGPSGPEGTAGRDGSGLVASYIHNDFYRDGHPVLSSSQTVRFRLNVQPDEFITVSALASASIGGKEGIVELPFLVQSSGGQTIADQASVLLGYDDRTDEYLLHYISLQGYYAFVRISIFKLPENPSSPTSKLIEVSM